MIQFDRIEMDENHYIFKYIKVWTWNYKLDG